MTNLTLRPMKGRVDHKHAMLLLTNSGKHYVWMCEICNDRYKVLKLIFQRLLKG